MTITAVGLLVTLTVGFLTAPLAAQAQGSEKVYRIGSLGITPPTTPELRRRLGQFDEELRELGYVEGKNLLTERRYYEGRVERARDLAAELVRLNVDLIVAWATPAAQAAQQATRKIPIVMVAVVDPVGAGLVASLARPAVFVEEGGLMRYGVNTREHLRQAAAYVDKILKGAKPADLPVQQPTKFELVINLKTAKALGLTLPQSLLLRADEIIQ